MISLLLARPRSTGAGGLRPCFPISPPLAAPPQVKHGPRLPSCLRPSSTSPPLVGGPGRLGSGVPRRRGAGCPERGHRCRRAEGSKEQAATASFQALEEPCLCPPRRKGDPEGIPGDAETFTAGRAAKTAAPRLRLPRPLGLARARAAAAVRPRAARGRSPGALPRSRLPWPARSPRAGVVQPSSAGLRWSPHLHWGFCCRSKHITSGVGRTGESEQRSARERLSQEVISAPSELAPWL